MPAVMPVEFALRPRIQLREASPRPKRSRLRLPRFALPVALYWAVAGGITYAFVHGHAQLPLASDANPQIALAAEPPRESRPWWRLAQPAPTPEPRKADPEPSPEPAPEPPVPVLAAPEPAANEPAANEAVLAAGPAVAETEPSSSPQPGAATTNDGVDSRAVSRALLAESTRPSRPARLPSSGAPERSTFDDTATDSPPAPSPTPAPSPRDASSQGLPSCEAAIESAHQDVDFSQGNGTADLPTTAIAAVLENGAWLSSCSVPASTSLEVCVAIRAGNVIGASVTARPANAELTACVRRRASSLQFPYSSHVDIARTRF